MLKLVLTFVFLLFIAVRPNPLQTGRSLNDVGIYGLEEACVRQGGLCLRIEDCDPDNLVRVPVVLCPKQRHLGVTCCYV